jgi:hypothetical protein
LISRGDDDRAPRLNPPDGVKTMESARCSRTDSEEIPGAVDTTLLILTDAQAAALEKPKADREAQTD